MDTDEPRRPIIKRAVEVLWALGLGVSANFATDGIQAAYQALT